MGQKLLIIGEQQSKGERRQADREFLDRDRDENRWARLWHSRRKSGVDGAALMEF